ncbi:MAG: dual specificity protein phosphatase family protein [Candidatus Ratteibacteria bacterium]|jgi:undecaprenyl-diphosphatase
MVKKTRFPSKLKRVIIAAAILIIAAGAIYLRIDQTGNFRTVSPGRVYRSGQLTEKQLVEYAEKYGIRSVLNLRGKNEQSDWWKQEIAASGQLSLKHYDIRLSSDKEPADKEVQELIAVLQEAPKPLLIHCLAGADRSGLVSAMYLYRFEGYSYEQARRQLSLIYGHNALLNPHTKAMDRAFADFCGK